MYILSCNVTIAVGHLTNLLSDTPDEWKTDNGGKRCFSISSGAPSVDVRERSSQSEVKAVWHVRESEKTGKIHGGFIKRLQMRREAWEQRMMGYRLTLPRDLSNVRALNARSSKFISESLNYPHTQHVSLYGSKYGVSNENEKLSMEICRDRQQPVNSVTWFSCKIKPQSLEEKTTWKIFT